MAKSELDSFSADEPNAKKIEGDIWKENEGVIEGVCAVCEKVFTASDAAPPILCHSCKASLQKLIL